ncbi:hypothetical protein [Pseudomonas sp. H1_D04]
MSEDKTVASHDGAKPLRISFDEAVSFFEAVCEDALCSACGTAEWEIPTIKGDDDTCALKKSGLSVNGKSILNLEIECLNCGLLRAHRALRIKEWVDSPESVEIDDE